MDITLLWTNLKYDIDQETWKAAKCHITEDSLAEVLNEAQTGIDTFDEHYCKRKIEQALMGLQDILHRFFVKYEHGTGTSDTAEGTPADDDDRGDLNTATADNELEADDTEWVITLEFDGRRNINAKLLATELHKYVVLYVLQEWSKMALPVMEQNYMQRMTLEENRIKRIAYRKEPPVLA